MNFFQKLIFRAAPEKAADMSPTAAKIWAAVLKKAKDPKEATDMLEKLVKSWKDFTAKDVGDWRDAWLSAVDPLMPRRHYLYDIYEQTLMVDGHLRGIVNQRKLQVLKSKFALVDKDGKEDREMTKLLRRAWFRKFVRLALDATYWGHTLVQFDGKAPKAASGRMEFTTVTLVPRNHVRPESGQVVPTIYDETGFPFREGPLADWCLEIGEHDDLGLFNVVAKDAISKKNMCKFWDLFGEIFGMPMRVAHTTSRNEKEKADIVQMLEQMGAAAYGLFPEGTDIKFTESSRTDSFKVYDGRIDRCNSEMSKAILGQTMTTDNGSSKSQGEVHERVLEDIVDSDKTDMADLVNDTLIPFMIRHGYPLDGLTFAWDDQEKLPLKTQMEVDKWILETFEVDEDFLKTLSERYRVPIKAIKARLAALTAPPPGKPGGDRGKGATDAIKALYRPIACCPLHGGPVATGEPDWLDGEFGRIAKALHGGGLKPGDLDGGLLRKLAEGLMGGVNQGYGQSLAEMDADTPDHAMLVNLRRNIYVFSGAKTYTELNELSRLLLGPDGKARGFAEFKSEALKVFKTYNVQFLQAEYNHAIGSAQMAANWVRIQQGKGEFPLLRYSTVGDDRVRESHRALDGIVRPVDDKFWDVYYPPNAWNCRCDGEQVNGGADVTDVAKRNYPAVEGIFRGNAAKDGVIFPEKHPYFIEAQPVMAEILKLVDKEIAALLGGDKN